MTGISQIISTIQAKADRRSVRRLYQESWQGIPVTSFAHISFFRLAESRFYSTFYEELFRHYKSWDDLPAKWLANKTWDANWLSRLIAEIAGRRCNSTSNGLNLFHNKHIHNQYLKVYNGY